MKNSLVIVPGYGNCLARMVKYVSKTCIYFEIITGPMKGGLINLFEGVGHYLEIPESENSIVY